MINAECASGTFDADKLRAYMAAGVTRFSIGVQVGITLLSTTILQTPPTVPPSFRLAVLNGTNVSEPVSGSSGAMKSAGSQACGVAALQAFQQSMLEACGRSHGLDDVEAALAAVTAAKPSRSDACSRGLLTAPGIRPVMLPSIPLQPSAEVCRLLAAVSGMRKQHSCPVAHRQQCLRSRIWRVHFVAALR